MQFSHNLPTQAICEWYLAGELPDYRINVGRALPRQGKQIHQGIGQLKPDRIQTSSPGLGCGSLLGEHHRDRSIPGTPGTKRNNRTKTDVVDAGLNGTAPCGFGKRRNATMKRSNLFLALVAVVVALGIVSGSRGVRAGPAEMHLTASTSTRTR